MRNLTRGALPMPLGFPYLAYLPRVYMNRPEKTHRPVRVALAHLFATGAHRPGTTHGLLHLGLLPLEAGAEVQQWLFNPERDNSRAVTEASGVSNDRAKSYPTWAESAPMVQAALLGFDALLIMDRAGVPSPERHWLEHHIMADMDRPPVCVGLDELGLLPTGRSAGRCRI